MERRITRSLAAKEAALLATSTLDVKPETPNHTSTPANNKRKRKSNPNNVSSKNRKSLSESTPNVRPAPKNPKSKKQKTQKKQALLKSNTADELPHNLGLAPVIPSSLKEGPEGKPHVKEEKLDQLAKDIKETVDKATETLQEPGEEKKGRKKNSHPYGLTPGYSPFPDWVHPTVEECEEVNKLLSSVHGEITPPKTIPEPSLTVTGCGEVPSVLDALIRTLLSGATTGKNSAMAFNGLVQKFGILEEGIGKGSVNWDAVRQASLKDVFEAIKSGGLADIKSKHLKAILDMVYEDNQNRKKTILEGPKNEQSPLPKDTQEYSISCANQNVLSLNHLHSLSAEQAMIELVKYPGIGPKTAACVILFCLQRPCFAVDTHVFRICKWLGWIPGNKATEVTAFSHLEVRIPDHLKYSLHQLFILHGKSCPRCRAITGPNTEGWEDGCVIDHLVTRSGKRKNGAKRQNKVKKPKKEETGEDGGETGEDS
ncbi:hypothetical protein PHISCL_01550 [Aspergillus sclerotialis]|uniref:HhH-GPD domain-containing protein n=1 Tax=Aspergillus sclerotialis TaxID=2070753 RepID=A0A3A2ZXM1_9EURO|nr:hypothetical protein PHISCL_01550 [Aspergillus sclerotialis]